MIFNPELECMSRQELIQLQIERLQSTLNRVYRNVAFYKHTFDKHNIDLEKIKNLKDLTNIPFTTRNDLGASYPYDMFAVPLREIVRIHSTSGTTAKPVVVGYTKNDLKAWSECSARLLSAGGVTAEDVVQIAFPYNLFTGAFGFHQGAEKIGASVIPASLGQMERQLIIMKDYKTTILVSSPWFALQVCRELEAKNIHPETLLLKTGIFGSEPWSEAMRVKMEECLHIRSTDTYGLTEIMGPGVAGECQEKEGLHICEDHFLVEVINPQTLEVLPPGQEGELVFTTITKEGFPLIRYRTGDISSIIEGAPCKCGRTTLRMKRISGRTDDMVFFKGQKLYPAQIEEILLAEEGIIPHFQIRLHTKDGEEHFEVHTEISEKVVAIDELKNLENLKTRIKRHLEKTLGIEAKITLLEPGSLREKGKLKIKRVIDERE